MRTQLNSFVAVLALIIFLRVMYLRQLQRRKQVNFYISCDEEKAEFEAELEEAKLKAKAQEESVEVTYAVGVKRI